jgi:putative endonuclease
MKEQGMFWVYVLQNPAGRFYIGQTEQLEIRTQQHNQDGPVNGKYTLKNGPWKLVWSEEHSTRSEAMKRERFIKSRKSSKWIREHLIGRAGPDVHRD